MSSKCVLRVLPVLLSLAITIASAGEAAAATTWLVPGNGSNTCTIVSPNCNTIAQAVTASSSGDTISIGAGTFSVPSAIALTKSLTIVGAGIGTTFVQPTSTAFSVRTSNITFSDFTVRNGATGIAFQSAASDNTQITRVSFDGQTSRGIDISLGAAFPVTNVAITDCAFATSNIGLRMSSTSQVTGLAITGTSFTGNAYGIYQANDGNTSKLANLAIGTCTFTNNTNYAIYAEEMVDSTIANSTFTGGATAISLLKFYSSNATPMSNIDISGNQFSGFKGNAMDIEMYGLGLGTPGLTIEGNTITKDVGIETVPAAVYVRLHPTQTNGQVDFIDNTITATGAFGAGTAVYGVQLAGNGPVSFTGNVIDGGNVGGSGTTPPSSGIFIQSKSGSTIMPATTVITASCNRIQDFHNGVSVFDSVAGAYGGLSVGASVTLTDNAILGNDSGVDTGAAAPTIDAENNYWGCPAGPTDPACDDVVGNVDANPFRTVIAPCVPCLQDFECNDGVICNGAETCDLGTNQCVAGTFAASGTACDDGSFCTLDDQCDGNGACSMSTPVDCDDVNPCTDDSCDSQAGGFLCQHVNNGSCIGPNCGNMVVDAGESCDPPNLATGPNGQPICRLDCTSCGDGVVQANDSETCDDGNTVSGCRPDKPQKPLDDCLNNCAKPICADPARIKFSSHDVPDLFTFHGRLISDVPVDFVNNHFVIELRDTAGRVVQRFSLLSGSIEVQNATSVRYKNRSARDSGGVYQVKAKAGDGYYVLTLKAYGDLSTAVADMTTHVYVGGDEWVVRGLWTAQSAKGWKLSNKATFLPVP